MTFPMRKNHRLGLRRRLALATLGAALLLGLSAGSASATPVDTQVKIDPTQLGRSFEGVGGSLSGAASPLLMHYPPAERREVLDYLFEPNYGASLQVLKIEIGGDNNSDFQGSEPSISHTPTDLNCNRGYTWWLMKEARKRNPKIKIEAVPLALPGWLGDSYRDYYSAEQIDYRIDWLRCARSHGLRIDNMGIWSETWYDTEWIKQLKAALVANGFASTKVIAADGLDWGLVEDMEADPELAKAIDIVGVHYPTGKSPEGAKLLGKPLWANEDGPWSSDWGAVSYGGALGEFGSPAIPALINRNYIGGRITSSQIWLAVTGFYTGLPYHDAGLFKADTPWSGDYSIRSAVWAVAHTTQFAEPGWRYVDGASGYFDPSLLTEGSYVTLVSPKHGWGQKREYSTILETMGAVAPRTVEISLAPGVSSDSVRVWRTNATQWFEKIDRIVPRHGRFELTLQPDSVYSVTTTTGQHKGSAKGRPAEDFPFPYRDDFDDTPIDQSPTYFSQQEGSFEAARCPGRGRCIEQEVTEPGVIVPLPVNSPPDAPSTFGGGPEPPMGFLGDIDWRDYEVSIRFRLNGSGTVEVLGRGIQSLGRGYVPFNLGTWNGYGISLGANGEWKLRLANQALATGSTGAPVTGWHRLGLAMAGGSIVAKLDGVPLTQVTNTQCLSGYAGFGTGFNKASFDDLKIEPVAGLPVKGAVGDPPVPAEAACGHNGWQPF